MSREIVDAVHDDSLAHSLLHERANGGESELRRRTRKPPIRRRQLKSTPATTWVADAASVLRTASLRSRNAASDIGHSARWPQPYSPTHLIPKHESTEKSRAEIKCAADSNPVIAEADLTTLRHGALVPSQTPPP